ncbi:hypothetical protein [Enterococcus sp. 5H]|uniref:hypothetical protein n=1 Tax=Enterococcus sp. 5H TaxID=1229490 RepID=UPI0023043DAD|nr:hypothetical protein [Enterococcus sp. 5H]MDA9471693.1 hypothetical protein [Enterococcus sp. 5H]
MKRLRYHIITIIVLIGSISFFSQIKATAQASEIEVHGQIGGGISTAESIEETKKEPETLAQPKQTHIALKKFPNTGSIIEKLPLIGLLLLLIYFLLKKWEAHRRKNAH